MESKIITEMICHVTDNILVLLLSVLKAKVKHFGCHNAVKKPLNCIKTTYFTVILYVCRQCDSTNKYKKIMCRIPLHCVVAAVELSYELAKNEI